MMTPHPSAFNPYLRHGWKLVPINAGSKGPRTPGWNSEANCINESSDIPEGMGAGLAHAFSGTCAIDLDDVFMAQMLFAERGIDLQALLDAHNAVQINSGRPGSGKLIYRLPAPMPSKSLKIGAKTIVEFRCATGEWLTVQDLLPPSRHPTGTTYQWGGKGSWQNLPMLPAELLTWWAELLEVKHDHAPSVPKTLENLDEVRDALACVPASCDHGTWLEVLMGLHSTGHPEAYEVARSWSASCPEKYPGDHTFETRWRSFGQKDNGITVASVFHHAKENGWVKPPVDVLALFNQPTEGLEDLLDGMVIRPPGVDLDLFPEVLRNYAEEVSIKVGCDVLVPLSAGLASVCAAIDSRSRLELVDGFKVPPVLWMMTIGSPADKKTPGSRPMFDVLSDIERDDAARFKLDMVRWEAEEAAYAAAKKDLLNRASQAEHMFAVQAGDALSGLPQLPQLRPMPVPKRLVISDSTSQKMVRIVADRPEGVLCYLDEAGGMFNKLTNVTSTDDRSTWVVSYEANRYFVDRVASGSTVAENFAVSMYCNVQPQIFRWVLPNLAKDGYIQRFIPITLRPSNTRLGHPMPVWSSCKPVWDHTIRQIHAAGERHYTLSPAASDEFRTFQQWYEDTKYEERLIRSPVEFMTAYGKLEGLTGRLALVMHMMEDRDNPQVGADTMRRAVELVREFVIPSFRYCYSDIGGLQEESHEFWITSHVLQIADEGTVSLSSIKRSGRRQWGDMRTFDIDQLIRDVMADLVANQWAAVVEENRKSTVWAINPALVEHFKERRKKIIAAKQVIKDRMRAHAEKLGRDTSQDARYLARGTPQEPSGTE